MSEACKTGCVFPMVIWSALRMGQYRVNDHPYHASQFIRCPQMLIIILELDLTPHLIRPAPLIFTTGYDPQHVPTAPNDSAPWFLA